MTGNDAWRATVTEALTSFRLTAIPPRHDWGIEQELARSAIAEVLRLRLIEAYLPLFRSLKIMERKIEVLANLKEDPYAPPRKRP